MRVMLVGLRGFPNVQGGVETHAEQLCGVLAQMGCQVEVVVRSPYVPKHVGSFGANLRFIRVWSPRSKSLEAIVHTFLGVLVAAWRRPDILHIHAIGPALLTPLARSFGLRVVVTHHGPDYNRQKWGMLGRSVLSTGERWGMRWSCGRIAISEGIRSLVREKHQVDAALIPNGVRLPQLPATHAALDEFALVRRHYVLLVSRLVPEKRHLDLIAGFNRADLDGWKLVLVGASDHPDVYQRTLIDEARKFDNVVMTGFQTGLALQELYAHAGMFVLPSSHEGLPIAMLEALSYGLPVLASDIPANREVGLPEAHYFPLGDIDAMASAIRAIATEPVDDDTVGARREWIAENYCWDAIALQTKRVYEAAADN